MKNLKILSKKSFIVLFTIFFIFITKNIFIEKNMFFVSINRETLSNEKHENVSKLHNLYQIFYTTEDNKYFSEEESIIKETKYDQKNITFKIKSKKIINFRLDIGSVFPPDTKIKQIKINDKILDLDKFVCSGIGEMKYEKGILLLKNNDYDPFIVYSLTLNDVKPKTNINYKLFFMFFLFYLLVSYLIINCVCRNKNYIDNIFFVCFLLFLFIPGSKLSNTEISIKENRRLNVKPDLFINGVLNKKYGTLFDNYFNDHFYGRNFLINIFSNIKYFLNKIYENENVIYFKKNNWMFYKKDDSLNIFQNRTLFSEKELKSISDNLSSINNFAKKYGKHFYLVIPPAKNKVYGEFFTSANKIRTDEFSKVNQLIKYLKENTDIKVIYPLNTFLNNKDKTYLYYRHDTHWNQYGAYLAYLEIINEIKNDIPYISPFEVVNFEKKLARVIDKDLERFLMLKNIKNDNYEYLVPVNFHSTFKNRERNTNSYKHTYFNENYNQTKGIKLMTFHDSFTYDLSYFYENTFSEIKYKWDFIISDEDKNDIINNDFDIIILECTERFINILMNVKIN